LSESSAFNGSKTAALTSSKTAEVRGLYDVDHEARVNFFSMTVQQLTLFLNMLFIAHMLNF
jgi:hypothetical protein